MAFIEVEFSELDSASGSIGNCLLTLDSQKNRANGLMNDVKASWDGSDADVFIQKWNELLQSDSSYDRLIRALESFQRYIKYARAQYENAQQEAYTRANIIF